MSDRVAATARWTAAVRAQESARDDALYRDPWAADLAGLDGMAWLAGRAPGSALPMVLRTRYFDDWLAGVLHGVGVRQVALLAAGLDTRAYRLAWPEGACCFELDRPAVLRHKAAVLEAAGAQSSCHRHTVDADLAEPWGEALIDAGFDAATPSAWLLEGVLFYLPNDVIARVLEEVSRLAAPGSQLGFDIVNSAVSTSPYTRPWVEMQAAAGAPWLGAMDNPVAYLDALGWRATLTQAGQPNANHGRWTLPVVPTTLPDFPHSWFVTAERVA
jgi:methyltransferase (TIGR00027 family)